MPLLLERFSTLVENVTMASTQMQNALNNTVPKKAKKKKLKKNVAAVDMRTEADKVTRKLIRQELGLREGMSLRSGFAKHIPQLAAALSMPKDYLVPRFGGSLGSDPTAIANPWARFDISYPAATTTLPDEMNPSLFPLFTFRDALRFSIFPYPLEGQSLYRTDMTYYPTMGLETFPKFQSVIWSSGEKVHGPNLYPGRLGPSDQHRGILLTQFNRLIITIDTALYPIGSSILLVVKRLASAQWVPVAEYSILAGAGVVNSTYTCTRTGYYAFSFVLQNSTIPFLNANSGYFVLDMGAIGFTNTTWAQRSLPHFQDAYPFVEAVSITGVSTMYTNTASPLNRQGQICGLQVPKGTYWLQFTDFDTVAEDKKSVTRDIVEGQYGFLKPTSAEDFKMRIFEFPGDQVNQTTDVRGEQLIFNIYPDSDYLLTFGNVNVDAGRVGYVTLAASVEYTTLNQWISVKRGSISESELNEALEVLSGLPQWHTNDLHWDDIWSWIKDTAKDVWNGIKEIAPIAAAAAPLFL